MCWARSKTSWHRQETKGLGGKGKLTDSMIDKMQNYYGIAIRSNTGDLEAMKKSILASLFHCASNDEHPWHSTYCPPGKDSWCRYISTKNQNLQAWQRFAS